MTTIKAIEHLCNMLRTDESYYKAWQANIAMAFIDVCHREGYKFPALYSLANSAATEFLTNLTKKPS